MSEMRTVKSGKKILLLALPTVKTFGTPNLGFVITPRSNLFGATNIAASLSNGVTVPKPIKVSAPDVARSTSRKSNVQQQAPVISASNITTAVQRPTVLNGRNFVTASKFDSSPTIPGVIQPKFEFVATPRFTNSSVKKSHVAQNPTFVFVPNSEMIKPKSEFVTVPQPQSNPVAVRNLEVVRSEFKFPSTIALPRSGVVGRNQSVILSVPNSGLKFVTTPPSQSFVTVRKSNVLLTAPLLSTDSEAAGATTSKRLPKKIECKICGKILHRQQSFIRHMATVHSEERPYSCEICAKPFKLPEHVKNHMSIHSNQRTFKCHLCEKAYKTQEGLKTHVAIHTNTPSHACEFCNKAFYYLSAMKHHIAIVHNKVFECATCKEKFSSYYKYKRHIKAHKGIATVKKYACTVCNKRFEYHNSLRKHLLMHEGKTKKYMCDVCGKTVTSKFSLRNHKLGHAGVKSIQCNDCGKMFLNMKYLNVHARIHTGERRYGCDVCNKKFTQRTTLVIHMRSHTGERPYDCDLCDNKFVSRCSLNSHKKSKHKIM